MLLCYLREFITVRYEKVSELSARYDGALKLNKQIVYQNQRITYSVDLHDERKNDAVLRENNPARAAIDRMDLMLKAVLSLLSTPLMEIAGKAPRLKPPITKTNVLKMDNNFKGAMALYEYVVAYEGLGYSVETQCTRLAPFSDALADELSEAGGMLLFLMYEYGLDLNGELKKRFDAAEIRAREEQIRRKERRLAILKKNLENREQTPEEYILELEEHIRLLESDNRRIPSMQARMDDLSAKNEALRSELESLETENSRLHDLLTEAAIAGEREKAKFRAQQEEHIYQLVTRHESDMSALKDEFEQRIRENEMRSAEVLQQRDEQLEAQREAFALQISEAEKAHEGELGALREELRAGEEDAARLTEERDRFSDENLIYRARIQALLSSDGVTFDGNAFTEKEDFNELERELEAFVRFYEERWGIAKKAIRKKLLSYQSLKGRNGKK